jgi:hypothetical protein
VRTDHRSVRPHARHAGRERRSARLPRTRSRSCECPRS